MRELTGEGARVLFVHAHPDDEAVQSGVLTAWVARHAAACAVLTCTRGEQGEIVPGSVPAGTDLVATREREIADALRELGVGEHFWLGTPPAAEQAPRVYRDSGMRWVAPGVAGPGDDTDPGTFAAADVSEAAADLAALIDFWQPTVVVSYDEHGSYGHPDHVRAYEVASCACAMTGVTRFEIASDLSSGEFQWHDLADDHERVKAALRCYRTQLSLDGDTIIHVGGQRQPIDTRIGIRRA